MSQRKREREADNGMEGNSVVSAVSWDQSQAFLHYIVDYLTQCGIDLTGTHLQMSYSLVVEALSWKLKYPQAEKGSIHITHVTGECTNQWATGTPTPSPLLLCVGLDMI